ncbi:asparaginase [Natroniella sulfidigena]|uniref:asparaginase n=1 Tax=Natroniella sulfidigena TaxID=723921 RepID=UPI00200A7087|nr:asparaginase [Natroniella sulfidigena]MCK8817296.1 asparaginase [Natroniella sulfidigena]
MKKIKIITTGGTIAMGKDQQTGQIVPKLSGLDLLKQVPQLTKMADLELVQYANLDSSQLTAPMLLELAELVEEALLEEEIDGVLITHGTDTLEETAYLLDLVLDIKKPVVITGALRSFSQLNSDGAANLVQSIQTILNPQSKNKGVLAVINEEIHAARFLSKMHTNNLNAFSSLNCGPIGTIDHSGIHYSYDLPAQITIHPEELEERVEIIKLAIGSDDRLIQAALDYDCQGLVLEAFGLGTLPEKIIPGLTRAKKEGVPVVITSRSYEGRVYNLYGASGGNADIRDLDLIFAGSLTSTKARLLLMLLLGKNLSQTKIREYYLKLKS